MTFQDMALIPPLLAAVQKSGYTEPTPIQQQTIPLVLAGKDVLGCAQTGTGKTAAFALPMLQLLNGRAPSAQGGKRPIRALILTPTRELALQIYENFRAYGARLPLVSSVIFGGVPQKPQTDALHRGVDILVATPGRLCDLMGQGFIRLTELEIFVLDEADRMLDMGFIHDVKRVIAQLPARRHNLFFSATMPREVEALATGILHNPATVKVDPVTSTVDSIRQALYMVDKANKRLLLAHLLNKPAVESALVFVRTKHGADRVVRELARDDIPSRAIHGNKSQGARQEALGLFKSGGVRVLVATDIAARGIDIIGLSHVFNYDLPHEPESYIHRIGRTGRAGLAGDAVSFCCIDEVKDLQAIEKLIGKAIPKLESPWPMQVFTPSEPTPRGPRPGRQAPPPRQTGVSARQAATPKHATPPPVKQVPPPPRRTASVPPAAPAMRREDPMPPVPQPVFHATPLYRDNRDMPSWLDKPPVFDTSPSLGKPAHLNPHAQPAQSAPGAPGGAPHRRRRNRGRRDGGTR
ncbi:MAG: DEAD/DEAH box helicase [Oscillospiraceae bacterium]|jgi:ATP-dependent RNA helicase RhlE|nr:DEAD/DEAH box helicase [Oscillospiraceae bacterium]